jgi:TusA-related sulfurtransferase
VTGDPVTGEPGPPVTGDPARAHPDLVLDCLGRPCPVPVIELARALRTLDPGTVVEVLSDDPAARADIPAFCRMRGHDYLGAWDLRASGASALQVRASRPS